ncbi:hypothetical protein SM0020_17117 [Sinorhizobium meliloti CCNWSX0020]|uniref:Uncharacterized protein n=1 Tax=Sinorhizobium meliloti CCNWSX0020 TaxID=1107881 RepID=H0G1T5_RHIML|nr:hypothetical protein SM0020_17117 [Sinorhizobium meliloti CCNWSX0020]
MSHRPERLHLPYALGWIILRRLTLVGMWVRYYLLLPKLTLSAGSSLLQATTRPDPDVDTPHLPPKLRLGRTSVHSGANLNAISGGNQRLQWDGIVAGLLYPLQMPRSPYGDFTL